MVGAIPTGQETPKIVHTYVIISPYGYNTLDTYITDGIKSILQENYKSKRLYELKIMTLYLNNNTTNSINKECINKINNIKPHCIFISNCVLYEEIANKLFEFPIYYLNYNSEYNNNSGNYITYTIDLTKLKRVINLMGISLNKYYILRNGDRKNSFNLSKLYINALHESFPNAQIEIKECRDVISMREQLKAINKEPMGMIVLSFRTIVNEVGDYITENDIVKEIMIINNKHLELGFDELTNNGLLFSCSPTFKDMGKQLCIDYLNNKKGNLTTLPSKLSLNYDRLKHLHNIDYTKNVDFFNYIDKLN